MFENREMRLHFSSRNWPNSQFIDPIHHSLTQSTINWPNSPSIDPILPLELDPILPLEIGQILPIERDPILQFDWSNSTIVIDQILQLEIARNLQS